MEQPNVLEEGSIVEELKLILVEIHSVEEQQ